ncbi:MAG: PEP-utilizing enzyme [Acidimicrobiia bacterium]
MTAVEMERTFPGPNEVEGFWAFDKMHSPRPVTPLAVDLIIATLSEGFTAAHAEFDAPIDVSHNLVHGFYYSAFHPMADQAAAEDRLTRYKDTLAAKVPHVGRLWATEWEPQIIAQNQAERDTDYTGWSDDQLLAKLEELHQRMRDQWQVHGRINFVLISAAAYCDFYDEHLQPADPTEAYQSIQGWETQSVEASRGLWRLSRIVHADQTLRTLFSETAVEDLVEELEKEPSGRAFLEELHGYLDRFGWRSDAVYDIGDVTWRENPAIPLAALASYVDLDDADSPEALHERAVRTREELQRKARERLAGDAEKLATFERLYEAARYSNPVTENHAFWIDQMGVTIIRRFVKHVGGVLAERGLIPDDEGVFMLTKAELVDTLRDGVDRNQLVAERRAELAACAKLTPPPALGEMPPPPPEPDPFMDAVVTRLLGVRPPDEGEADPNVLTGVAGSPGVVRGTVKVVRSLAEASVLEDGDIMVCEMTLPPWVPLFSIVSGVVADTGGVLSHCAIVAREFELPAVVGTLVGTTTLQNGMVVEVDGSKGTVTILERPA